MTTLADQFVPKPHFAERHHIEIPAARVVVWDAWQQLDLSDPPLVARFLFGARDVIARLRHGHAHLDLPDTFIPLAEERPVEQVKGVVGTWWTFGADSNRVDVSGRQEFLDFAEPGYGKAIVGMRFEDIGGERTRVTTETRVVCTDEASRRGMARYWPLIRPFSGLIRIMMLRALRSRALR
ncbi:hypothetical protein [Nonomuraea sp. NPDC049400]|uniref:hypothetical protein n=1 Tax=Nonomuraea sp. NPDC049400 TaxID=3364352 RepID=UPI003793E7A0